MLGVAKATNPRRREQGSIDELPSGALRVRVYAGTDPITKRRHDLVEVVPPGPGAGEVSQVAAAMRACRELAGPRRFLLVGDSKLVSYSNLCDMITAVVEFIAPASKTYVRAAELAALDRGAGHRGRLRRRARQRCPSRRAGHLGGV